MPSPTKDLSVAFGLTPSRVVKLAFFAIGIIAAANTATLGQYFGISPSHQTAVVAMSAPAGGAANDTPLPAQSDDAAAGVKESFLDQAARFEHSTLRLNDDHFDFSHDWWKYCVMLLVLSVSLFFITKAGAALVRLCCLAFCLAFSTFAAYIIGPILAPVIQENFPQLVMKNCPAIYWAYLAVFIVAYLVASVIVFIMKRPLKPVPKIKE